MKTVISTATTTLFLTALALIAFAGNSILARLALGDAAIDPASYTAVRLVVGAATLWLITFSVGKHPPLASSGGSWTAGALLFLYALAFSIAYTNLSAGTGALILFATVQITMISVSVRSGETASPTQWLGLCIALGGLAYLVFPGVTAPSLIGSVLMAAAGIAWGAYSLLGRGASNPIQVTADNFARTVPLVVPVVLFQWSSLMLSRRGFLWASVSGAITSGLGYVVWYMVLPRLTTMQAATVQLAVPVVAALGGVLLLSEDISARLLVSSLAILGGIALSVCVRGARGEPAKTRR